MLENYLPVLIHIVVACGFAAVTLILSVALGRSAARSPMKDSAYECGMLPIGESQPRFSVKFYIVAMLFVIFDIEVVFMYPWALVFRDFVAGNVEGGSGATIFFSMLSFAGILLVAYVYALRKGALSWKQ